MGVEIENEVVEEEVASEEVVSENEEVPESVEGEVEKVEPEEYSPNHKYTFMDQEYEFDDKLKSFIKTKDDETLFRDMVTAQKAHEKYKEFGGIREIETKLGEHEEYGTKAKSFEELNTEVNQLQGMLQKGNIEQFRSYLGIPKEQLLDWAIAEAKAQQDPNAAQALQQQYEQQQQHFNLQYQHDMMQNSIQEQQIQARTNELDQALESTEVAKAYDDLVGTPGSFRQAVIDQGIAHHQTTGRDTTVQAMVDMVAQRFQGLVANQSVGTQQNPQPEQPVKSSPEQTVVINQNSQQTIPNLKAGSQTPAKKKIMSLADIKKAAAALD